MAHQFRPVVLARLAACLSALVLVVPLGAETLDLRTLADGPEACLLIHARILPMTDERDLGLIEDGWLQLDDDGTIVALGPMSRQPRLSLPTFDCGGMLLTPGLINASTDLGLSGHPVVSMTQDAGDASERFLPQLRVTDGINPVDKAIPRVRAAGVTTVYVTPGENSLVNGQGALLKLRISPDIADLVLKAPAGMHMNLGEGPKSTWGGRGGPSTRMGTAAQIRGALIGAQNARRSHDKYLRDLAEYDAKVARGETTNKDGDPLKPPDPPDRNLVQEAVLPVLDGEIPVILSCHRQDDILTGLRIAEEFHLKVILLHATGAWQVLPEISASGFPILVGPVRTGPGAMETLAARLDNAALIHEAEIPFAIQTGDALGARALAHEAAWAMSAGLPRREALLAITRYPAEIFGIDDRVGSLAPGMDADLVLWDADPLVITSTARYVFIEGRLVSDSDAVPMFIEAPGW